MTFFETFKYNQSLIFLYTIWRHFFQRCRNFQLKPYLDNKVTFQIDWWKIYVTKNSKIQNSLTLFPIADTGKFGYRVIVRLNDCLAGISLSLHTLGNGIVETSTIFGGKDCDAIKMVILKWISKLALSQLSSFKTAAHMGIIESKNYIKIFMFNWSWATHLLQCIITTRMSELIATDTNNGIPLQQSACDEGLFLCVTD